jgi:hypothetical protein
MIFVSLYLIGVALSGIYAKYKRATTLGIKPWKVILSMPFAFLLMWTPGYLIKDKDTKSVLFGLYHLDFPLNSRMERM